MYPLASEMFMEAEVAYRREQLMNARPRTRRTRRQQGRKVWTLTHRRHQLRAA